MTATSRLPGSRRDQKRAVRAGLAPALHTRNGGASPRIMHPQPFGIEFAGFERRPRQDITGAHGLRAGEANPRRRRSIPCMASCQELL